MHPTAAATRRRAAEMLIRVTVLRPQRPEPNLKHRDKSVQRIVRHLTNTRDLRILRAQVFDESSRPLVHVTVGAVHMATNNVQKIRVDVVPGYHVGDPSLEVLTPRICAEVHVCKPAITMTIVVPIDPIET